VVGHTPEKNYGEKFSRRHGGKDMEPKVNIEHNPVRSKLKWHPAFMQAIQMELFDYRDSLEFKYEYQLTSEPLRIDLLIIKKPKNLSINKNIARIFKSDNLIEYKSPEDYLSVKDFLKVYAYANLYAAINHDVDLSDITLTFIESRHPRKLLRYLSGIRGYAVEETSPGIFLVTGDYLPIQIIESKKLPESENLWLSSLRNDLKVRNAGIIIQERQKRGKEASLDAYLDILLKVNPETFLEVQNMARRATFEEVFTKAGIIPEWIERGREEEREIIARNLLAKGMTPEFVQEITGFDIETITALTD
jgi:hypothetical protein